MKQFYTMRQNAAKRAFTLVELLIVVIIIGILAAVAVPQFGDSATDAKVSALGSNLAAVRNAIELYYHQHNSKYLGIITTHKAGAAAAAAHADVGEAFAYQLTMYSNAAGHTSDTKDTVNFPYGPYLRQGMPHNPLPAANAVNSAADVTVGTAAGPITAEADPATGWHFSSETGIFIANNADYDDR